MAKLLSQKIVVGSFSIYPKSLNSFLNHTTWHDVVVVAMYYAFADEIETMGSFLDAHEIRFLLKRDT